MRRPPRGFDILEERLDELEDEMKEAVQSSSLGVLPSLSTSGTKHQNKDHIGAVGKKRQRNEEEKEKVGNESEEVKTADETEDGGDDGTQTLPPLWQVARINRDRTRYVYNAYYVDKTISKEVWEYCVEQGLIDGGLARRWRLSGYERLCCATCAIPGAASTAAQLTAKLALRDKAVPKKRQQPNNASTGSSGGDGGETEKTCLCRVPISQRRTKHFGACAVCGCKGCSSAQ